MWTSHNEIGDTAFDAPLHFAHLYASDELMKMTQVDLLRPAHERQHDINGDQSGEGCDESGSYIRNYDRKAAQQQQVHVLSPQLVRCVAQSGSEGAVVWANVIPGHFGIGILKKVVGMLCWCSWDMLFDAFTNITV